jgi:hypothetical protein
MYILSYSSYYYFNIESQIQRIFSKLNQDSFADQAEEGDFLNDIHDGKIYSQFKEKHKEAIANKLVFSLSINTDGIKFADKSSLSLWPVFLTINELKLEERYSFENVIVAGIKYLYSLIYSFVYSLDF